MRTWREVHIIKTRLWNFKTQNHGLWERDSKERQEGKVGLNQILWAWDESWWDLAFDK